MVILALFSRPERLPVIEAEVTGLARTEVIVVNEGIGEAAVEMVPAEQELVLTIRGAGTDACTVAGPDSRDSVEARFCCSPHRVKALVIGWLVGEGVIEAPEEFVALETDLLKNTAEVRVSDACYERLARRIEAGARAVLGDMPLAGPADTSLEMKTDAIERLAAAYRQLFLSLRSADRMCYLCGLATERQILAYGEGFHRVNALYRAMGELVRNGRSPQGRIAMANFGLSRALVTRLIRARVGMAVCLAPPTDSAIQLANDFYLTIVCPSTGEGTRVYSAPWRVI